MNLKIFKNKNEYRHRLPELLGTNLCSLRSNVDRMAFSCIANLDKNAQVLSVKFCKSIIRSVGLCYFLLFFSFLFCFLFFSENLSHSTASLTYKEAQLRIDDKEQTDPLTLDLRNLLMLCMYYLMMCDFM
jgi:exosome complex exonuclease DIS3/RRP44